MLREIWCKITDYIVRKQSLTMLPDGTFVCTSNGKEHHLKNLLEGLTNNKECNRLEHDYGGASGGQCRKCTHFEPCG